MKSISKVEAVVHHERERSIGLLRDSQEKALG